MNNKIWQIYAWGTLFFAFISLAIFGYWLFFPTKVIEYKKQPFEVITKTVRHGEELRYKVDYCKYVSATAITTRTFVDSLVFATPTHTANWETGCHLQVISMTVPTALPPGKYYLLIYHEYELNPIRTVKLELTTEPFEVLE